MKDARLHHISLKTNKSRQEAIKFYRDFMGFSLAETVCSGDDQLLYFQLPSSGLLEIIVCGKLPDEVSAKRDNLSGFAHIALFVDDLESMYRKVSGRGYPLSLDLTEFDALNIRTFIFSDPFGMDWEIMEENR